MKAAGVKLPDTVEESVERCLRVFFGHGFRKGHVTAHFLEFIHRDIPDDQLTTDPDIVAEFAADNWLRRLKRKGRVYLHASGDWEFVDYDPIRCKLTKEG
jgi:hypothetical protein